MTQHEASSDLTSCSWDSFGAYLCDIDGTLLNCRDAVHYFAFCDALSWVAGRPLNLDGVQTHGSTDVVILADAFRLAAIEEAHWRPHLSAMQERMSNAVLDEEHAIDPEVLPGVPETLEHLRSRGALLGVATGNFETIGWAKLRRAGLATFFHFGGFSTDAPTRPEIFAAAAQQARELRGRDVSICVIGDTPADIIAAQSIELPVIAVATGIYSLKDMEAHRPTWCVSDLRALPSRPN